jgi:hypothetical protein
MISLIISSTTDPWYINLYTVKYCLEITSWNLCMFRYRPLVKGLDIDLRSKVWI